MACILLWSSAVRWQKLPLLDLWQRSPATSIWILIQANQKRPATAVLELARWKLKSVSLHDCIRVPTFLVEKSKTDHRNLLGVVVDIDQIGLFRTETKPSFLNSKFCRNHFALCDQRVLTVEDLPTDTQDIGLFVRQAIIAIAKFIVWATRSVIVS